MAGRLGEGGVQAGGFETMERWLEDYASGNDCRRKFD